MLVGDHAQCETLGHTCHEPIHVLREESLLSLRVRSSQGIHTHKNIERLKKSLLIVREGEGMSSVAVLDLFHEVLDYLVQLSIVYVAHRGCIGGRLSGSRLIDDSSVEYALHNL